MLPSTLTFALKQRFFEPKCRFCCILLWYYYFPTQNYPVLKMHDIEPFYRWRDLYIASEDERSPFYQREYNEFYFTKQIYNYYIHPQWDEFGSNTLYLKLLFADYEEGSAILELIGEWNDCLHNDIMYLKRNLIEPMMEAGISRFALICENVLNFHGSDDCYYEEWAEEVRDNDGWICFVNTLNHVSDEMHTTRLQYYVHFGPGFDDVNWRPMTPQVFIHSLDNAIRNGIRRIRN